jgi:hypothetical protein
MLIQCTLRCQTNGTLPWLSIESRWVVEGAVVSPGRRLEYNIIVTLYPGRLGKVGEEEVDPQQWLGSGMHESAQDCVSWRARVANLSLKPGSHPPQRAQAYLSSACKEGGSC